MHLIQRNIPNNIERRYKWVLNCVKEEMNMDYMSNYVFINETAFNINLKRSMAQSAKETRAEVVVPETRAKITMILDVVSPFGAVNI